MSTTLDLPPAVIDALDAISRVRAALVARRASECRGDPPRWVVPTPAGLRRDLGLEIYHATPADEAAYEAELAALRRYDRDNRALLAEALRAHQELAPIKAYSLTLRDRLARAHSLPETLRAVLAFRDGLEQVAEGEAAHAFLLDLDQTIAGLRDAIFFALARQALADDAPLLQTAADQGWLADRVAAE